MRNINFVGFLARNVWAPFFCLHIVAGICFLESVLANLLLNQAKVIILVVGFNSLQYQCLTITKKQ